MTLERPPVPRRYRSAAAQYVQGRLSYPDKLIRQVIGITGVGRSDRVLDLGCGPGFLAVALKPYVGEVIGIDPEPDMLEQAQAYAGRFNADVTFIAGSSDSLTPELGTFRVVTMGRSFHWMDRARTLQSLEALVPVGGSVVLFADKHPVAPENHWRRHYEAVLAQFSSFDASYHARHHDPDWVPNESFLRASSFNELTPLSIASTIQTPIPDMIARAQSMSVTTPEKLGARREAFIRAVEATLLPVAVNGRVAERVEWTALIGRRQYQRAR